MPVDHLVDVKPVPMILSKRKLSKLKIVPSSICVFYLDKKICIFRASKMDFSHKKLKQTLIGDEQFKKETYLSVEGECGVSISQISVSK